MGVLGGSGLIRRMAFDGNGFMKRGWSLVGVALQEEKNLYDIVCLRF